MQEVYFYNKKIGLWEFIFYIKENITNILLIFALNFIKNLYW